MTPSYILISRTDSIGDVVLTLPMAKALKDHFPGVRIGFIGKNYTKAVINTCVYVDDFIDVEEFMGGPLTRKADAIIHVFPRRKISERAKELKIPLRIGTTNRIYHWLTCNKLVKLSRRKSELHEAQLNLKLLKAFNINTDFSTEEIGSLFGLKKLEPLEEKFKALLSEEQYNLILHPKSQGSAREWGLDNFIRLTRELDPQKFKIFISGTQNERPSLQPIFDAVGDKVVDITGVMNLAQFISFIDAANGLVANSTGPLHIAAALGRDALGLYAPRKSINPQRWKPLGPHAAYFVIEKNCDDCKERNSFCHCIQEISPALIKAALEARLNNFGI